MATSFSITVNPEETIPVYGVNSTRGYIVESKQPMAKADIQKIREIIGNFLGYERAQEQMQIRNEKFLAYVEHHPKEEWASLPEYSNYQSAKIILDKEYKEWTETQHKYEVIRVTPFADQ